MDRGRHLQKKDSERLHEEKNYCNRKCLNHSLKILASVDYGGHLSYVGGGGGGKYPTAQPSCFTMVPPILHKQGIKANPLCSEKSELYASYRAEQLISARLKTTANRNTD